MTVKPVVLRAQARQDVEAAIDFYAREGGEAVALRFIGELEVSIGARRAAGSPRLGQELGLAGVRSRLVRRFPFLIFYVERPDVVDVWRVLHARRDIPSWLSDPGA